MFVGTIIPPILTEYYEINLIPAIFFGALVSIMGNLILLIGLKHKLVKVFSVKITDEGKGKEEWKVEKRP